jgi:IS5 family transposase
MQLQGSFSQAEYAGKKKQTRRDRFLAEMEQVVPWARLVDRLRPFYAKGERGRPPIGLERMLRIYFLQQWYGLADEALEDALYDSQALRGFAGIDLSVAAVPDATTVLNFRHWLEQHDLTRVLFDEVGAMLEERGLLMRQGTIVDATIIAAPPSTKNKSKARDPEMHQTKKGNQWHFGMKAHIGVDVASGVVHTVTAEVAIPTIGIGGSPACDGQILVVDDMLGLFAEFTPKFVKRYRCLGDEIRAAAREYADEVKQGRFPAEEHTYPGPRRATASPAE